jgi:hypothetical protein
MKMETQAIEALIAFEVARNPDWKLPREAHVELAALKAVAEAAKEWREAISKGMVLHLCFAVDKLEAKK